MANISITDECRHELGHVSLPNEYLRDTIARLVKEEITRKNITVLSMPVKA